MSISLLMIFRCFSLLNNENETQSIWVSVKIIDWLPCFVYIYKIKNYFIFTSLSSFLTYKSFYFRLRNSKASIKFVTNTTKESKNILHKRLTRLGFNIKKEEIFSSLAAARELVKNRKLNPLLLIDDAAMEDFEDLIDSNSSPNAVVVGLAPEKFNYNHLNEAFRLLLNGAPLVAIHEGRYYKRPDGLALGPGAFVKGLEYSSNVKAEVVGKPTPTFFKAALQDVLPEEAIMIGDDVKDDIAGAQAIGIKGFLVKTGKYRSGDENTIEPSPTKVCDSFTKAVDIILEEYV